MAAPFSFWGRQRTMQSDIAAQIMQYITALGAGETPDSAVCLRLCQQAVDAGLAAQALPLLQALYAQCPADAAIAQALGLALRETQQFVEAAAVFAAASAAHLQRPGLLFGLAQTRFELGLPAAALFAQASDALPDQLDITRNRAAAMAAEGDADGAETLLTATLLKQPDWLDGHKGLATLRWTSGNQAHFADSYAAACTVQPKNAALWLAWFRAVAQTKDWPKSTAILKAAEQQLGSTSATLVCRLFVASESGDAATADALFARTSHIQGDTINLCRIRHFMRHGRYKEAESVAISLLLTPSATLYWPYLSLIWRLLKDERHIWIDRPDVFIKNCAIDMSAAELAELADVLRGLHTMQQPYIEQSVRGGTQTDRSVILRHEPILQRTRKRWMEAMKAYVADLPAFEQGHPLLGLPRHELLVEGSWSVRLQRQGYNVPHTHPLGWLSCVLYVALSGNAPAGHIVFGTPPEELGVTLPAYHHIAPHLGALVTFPSTTWHGTVPFEGGERLVLALDMRRPRF
jgi:Tfp pilus assembly protein PilF